MKKIVIATKNERKLKELRRLLGDIDINVLSLADVPNVPTAEENGESFEENSGTKALFYADKTGIPCLADDSGLEVEALCGEPGVKSARYAGANATDTDLCEKLLNNLKEIPAARRNAKFICAATFASSGKIIFTVVGTCSGKIGFERRGTGGFGYDSVFYPNGRTKTFAEMSPEEKDALSHRSRALTLFKKNLMKLLEEEHRIW
ncbi:MAG: RdgB/HAM1 family non-canonical purine NTP pyrophosphatase [Planctomycetota bacterium]